MRQCRVAPLTATRWTRLGVDPHTGLPLTGYLTSVHQLHVPTPVLNNTSVLRLLHKVAELETECHDLLEHVGNLWEHAPVLGTLCQYQ